MRTFLFHLAISGVVVFLSACSTLKTDPIPAFNCVRECVQQRTGHTVVWDRQEGVACGVEEWIIEALQEELALDKALQVALLNNPGLKATFENLGVAQAQLVQAGLLKNPIFDLSLRYENLVDSASIIEMGLLQNFLDILLKPMKRKMACAELEAAKSDVAGQIMALISETKIAYHTLQAAQQTLKMRKEVLDVTEAACAFAKGLYEAGNITHLDLSIEESVFEMLKIDVLSDEINLLTAQEKLGVLLGLEEMCADPVLTAQPFTIPIPQLSAACIENHAVKNSFDLQAARNRMKATALHFGIEVNEAFFTEVFIGVDSERDPDSPWFVGPQLSIGIPLFDTGSAKRASGYAELSRQWYGYLAMKNEIRSAARTLSFRVQNTFQQVTQFRGEVIPLKEKITGETLRQVNAMQIGIFDLLRAKRDEVEAKIMACSFEKDYWIARAELEMLLNGKMKRAANE